MPTKKRVKSKVKSLVKQQSLTGARSKRRTGLGRRFRRFVQQKLLYAQRLCRAQQRYLSKKRRQLKRLWVKMRRHWRELRSWNGRVLFFLLTILLKIWQQIIFLLSFLFFFCRGYALFIESNVKAFFSTFYLFLRRCFLFSLQALSIIWDRLKALFTDRNFRWLLLFFIGLQLALLALYYRAYQKTILSFRVAPSFVVNAELRGQEPTEIVITAIGLELPVIQTSIQNGIWQIPDTMVAHLASSARPREGSNIVLYAHNTQQLFARLPQVKVGDEVILTSGDGQQFHYQITETKIVNPNQVQEVVPTDYEVLTVYTCTGWLDSQRFVVKARPVDKQVLGDLAQ